MFSRATHAHTWVRQRKELVDGVYLSRARSHVQRVPARSRLHLRGEHPREREPADAARQVPSWRAVASDAQHPHGVRHHAGRLRRPVSPWPSPPRAACRSSAATRPPRTRRPWYPRGQVLQGRLRAQRLQPVARDRPWPTSWSSRRRPATPPCPSPIDGTPNGQSGGHRDQPRLPRLAHGPLHEGLRVHDAASRSSSAALPTARSPEANDVIWDNKLNSLPIVDDEGRLVYLVFRKDYDSHKANPNELLDIHKRYHRGCGHQLA